MLFSSSDSIVQECTLVKNKSRDILLYLIVFETDKRRVCRFQAHPSKAELFVNLESGNSIFKKINYLPGSSKACIDIGFRGLGTHFFRSKEEPA